MVCLSCRCLVMGDMDHLKQQAQEMSPRMRRRGAQKLYGRTAALALVVSLGGLGGLGAVVVLVN